jgi:hypothetical protein
MTRTHARNRWPAFERLEDRRRQLCRTVLEYDRRPACLCCALRKCPEALAARYNRLCRISSLYRVAAVLGADL